MHFKTYMEPDSRYLDRLVLETVSSDYVPFEDLVKRVEDLQNLACNTQVQAGQIQRSLLASIAGEHIGAYSLHADPPFVSRVEATAETIEWYWFYITESGERLLQQMLTSRETPPPPDHE